MERKDVVELFYYNFSQFSLIENSTIPKTKTKFTKTFKNELFKSDNNLKTVENSDFLSFLQETLPTQHSQNITERQIGTRMKLYYCAKIHGHDSIKYCYAKKLENYIAPDALNNQPFSVYAIFPEFYENLNILDQKPSKSELLVFKNRKKEMMQNTNQLKFGFLFDNPVETPEYFPKVKTSSMATFLSENGFESRPVRSGIIRCYFVPSNFTKVKSLLETFEESSLKTSSGQTVFSNHTVRYFSCCFSGTSVSTHGQEPRSQNCNFKLSFHFSNHEELAFVDVMNEKHRCSDKSSKFTQKHRGIRADIKTIIHELIDKEENSNFIVKAVRVYCQQNDCLDWEPEKAQIYRVIFLFNPS